MASRRTSAVVTTDEIDKFFTGNGWKDPEVRDGIRTYNFKDYVLIDLKEIYPRYRYEVHAVEDESDSEDGVTEKPTKALSDFIFGNVPGGESIDLASSPDGLAYILRAVAAGVESGSVGPRRLAKVLRRCSLLPGMVRTSGEEKESMEALKREMKRKGWRVQESKTDTGKPTLEVDVSGIYEATVELDSIEWEHVFTFIGPDRLVERGSGPDPIKAFRAWVKTEEYKDAVEEREDHMERLKDAPPESFVDTQPADQGDDAAPDREKGTMPAAPDREKRTMPAVPA